MRLGIRTANHRRATTLLIAGLAFAGSVCAVRGANALDFTGGCGANGTPITGWNGNTDARGRTAFIPCEGSKTFTVQFNATLTQDDINAGGLKWKLVSSKFVLDDMLLESTVACAKLAALPAGTELIGEAKFTLRCVKPPQECKIEGVSLDEITIRTRSDKKLMCSVKGPASSTGSSSPGWGENSIQLALEDVPGGGNEYGCNQLRVGCTHDRSLVSWDGPSRARSGESVATALVSATPVFTANSTVGIGRAPGVTMRDVVFVSPYRLEGVVDVAAGVAPQPLSAEAYDTNGAADVPPFVVDPNHWAHHLLGAADLTVTGTGRIGYLDDARTLGSGFGHPESGENLLFVGGFWFQRPGAPPMNLDFGGDPAAEWGIGTDPGAAVAFVETGPAREVLRAVFTDAGGGAGLAGSSIESRDAGKFGPGLADRFASGAAVSVPASERTVGGGEIASGIPTVRVEQESRADANASWVYLRYRVTNLEGIDWPGCQLAVFADFDVAPDAMANFGGTDPARRLTWIGNGIDRYAGIVALEIDAAPLPLANATLVANPIHVWPNGHLLDADRAAFLTGADPEHRLPASDEPSDYSALVSIGPLDVPAWGTAEVVFAMVAGSSLAELLANADLARQRWAGGAAAIALPARKPAAADLALSVAPNPFVAEAHVSMSLGARQPIDLAVFDLAGRRVRTLAKGEWAAGTHRHRWDGRDEAGRALPKTVYFVRLAGDAGTRVTRIAHVR